MLIPALQQHVDLDIVGPGDPRPATGDLAIYQLGNNPHHESAYREAMRHPGVIVLHDVVLHHLIVEMTLARGDAEGYVEAMRANHGEMGAAWARGRIIGLHDELAIFLLPASIDVANRSRAVIVHNQYAAERLHSLGVTTPIHVVPHPYPSAGETSGTLIRAFDAGKPVAVSDYAQFAELPDDCVTKIPFGPDEVARLAEFFLRDHPSPAAAQRRWLEENARMDLTVQGYLNALSGVPV